jgi:outer membrane lipoprotein-sorting protein
MKLPLKYLAPLLLLCMITPPAAAAIDASKIVANADRIRFPDTGFEVAVRITTTAPDKQADIRDYKILSKGNDKTLVYTMTPASERGQIMLMSGRDLWVFMPNVSQPIRLPLAQRLTGPVANGDLARANFSGDYDAKVVAEENLDGKMHYVLELTANRRGVTYDKVRYWVEKETYWPHKAEFYALSGRLLKRCEYANFQHLGDTVRPTRLIMHDALNEGQQSILDYGNLQLRDLPDRFFSRNYLNKLK